MMSSPPQELLGRLADRLGPKGYSADPADLAPWLTDWRGRYRGQAAALLSPASAEEVGAVVGLCAAAGVPLVPQGGNTSMVGGATPDSTGDALILSLRRMNAIRSLDREANLAVCEAGVVLETLHNAALAEGRRFPLSLAAKGSATIGGLVSTNAGGTQVLRFGTMRSLVQGVEAVLPDGSLFNGLSPLKKDNRGYNLTQLLIGAEGTLAIVTAASLKLVPAVGSRVVAWAGLASAADALRLLRHLEAAIGDVVESFELVPRTALDLVLAHVPGTRPPLAEPTPWNVLVEAVSPIAAASPEKPLYGALRSALELGIIQDVAIASSEAQAGELWRLRETISEAERQHGPAAKHDISVTVEQMPGFMTAAAMEVEERFPGTQVIAFGHLGDGNVHFNVAAPRGAGPDWVDGEGTEVSVLVHDLVTGAGGSISAEHGIGQMKLGELARLADPARLAAMRAIKHALDPAGIMNPGKLVPPADGPAGSLARERLNP
ncbi:FAD-binding oxidoreductase [Sphingosinicella sp. YJ22]|uniref:FAD-binding oxidoreductase n=1 Tax=Sphingosinicella sp. YJ22 TaxID=1104780 RepID=UPI00140D1945|nr:FAD-binding oxidoreductase [Sphingosinicella sp. YJ22]